MITDEFKEVLGKEGVVSIVSWAEGDAHVVNTWNSYVVLKDNGQILIPAYGMRKTEKNVLTNNHQIKLTLGSKEVHGFRSLGTGFLICGTAEFIKSGAEFDEMKARYDWLTRVLRVTPLSIKQTL